MVLLDLREFDAELTGKVAQEVLDRAGITTNRNTIPDDPRSPFITSGLRVGTAAETTAGHEGGRVRDGRHVDGARAAPPRRRARSREVRGEVAALCATVQPLRQLHEVVNGQHRRLRRRDRSSGRS